MAEAVLTAVAPPATRPRVSAPVGPAASQPTPRPAARPAGAKARLTPAVAPVVRLVTSAEWGSELAYKIAEAGFIVERTPDPLDPFEGKPPLLVVDVDATDVADLGPSGWLKRVTLKDIDPGEVVFVGRPREGLTRSAVVKAGAFDLWPNPKKASELIASLRGLASARRRSGKLRRRLKEAEHELEQRDLELESSRVELINCLTKVSIYRNGETGLHLNRVGRYTRAIAENFGCDPEFVRLIGMASPLHDIGKVGIPDAILLKEGKFTDEEMEVMRQHVRIGGELVESLTKGEAEDGGEVSPVLAMAGRIAWTHHERFDGTGYPRKIAGQDIPLEGRITAVADVFDALTTERPYKPAFDFLKALKILREGSGVQFDPDVLDAFWLGLEEIVELRYAQMGDIENDAMSCLKADMKSSEETMIA